MIRRLEGSRAIVTGASSGIGRAIALELARRGARLLITARRAERLAETAAAIRHQHTEVQTVVGDLTQAETRHQIVETARQAWNGIDCLVNNAGVGAHGRFESAAPERLRQIMEVNFFAPVELIRLALPLLRQGNRPIVVNVSSVLGHRAAPFKSEYCASKFALHGMSDALRAEWIKQGIDVLLISPSTTASEFTEHVLEDKDARPSPATPMSPERVARAAVRAIQQGRHELILPLSGKLLVWLDRCCPPLADWLVARYG
jgi:short-subunit dehydrogenase